MDCNFGNSINDILVELVHTHFLRIHSYLDKIGIHPGQAKLLHILQNFNGSSQREICNKLNVKPSTIAVMIKRMEKTELIVRKSDENDQRVSRIFITEKGLEVCEILKEIHKEIEKECFANFTKEEIDMAKTLISKMRDNFILANKKCREASNKEF